MCVSVPPGPWRDCLQALEDGHDTSSIYLVKPENTNRLMQVWCDQRHDPGGWTVIQRRLDGSVNFFRNWETYKVRTSGPICAAHKKIPLKQEPVKEPLRGRCLLTCWSLCSPKQ